MLILPTRQTRKLVTVVVPDEFKNGKKLFDSMKWSLHNVHNIHRNSCLMGSYCREDIPTLEAFFKCIQGKVAIVNTLMTDDGICIGISKITCMYHCYLLQTRLYLWHLKVFILTYSADGI